VEGRRLLAGGLFWLRLTTQRLWFAAVQRPRGWGRLTDLASRLGMVVEAVEGVLLGVVL
jgi:hypothetical protein